MDIVEDKAMVVTLRAKIPGKKNSTKSYGKEIFGKEYPNLSQKRLAAKWAEKLK